MSRTLEGELHSLHAITLHWALSERDTRHIWPPAPRGAKQDPCSEISQSWTILSPQFPHRQAVPLKEVIHPAACQQGRESTQNHPGYIPRTNCEL